MFKSKKKSTKSVLLKFLSYISCFLKLQFFSRKKVNVDYANLTQLKGIPTVQQLKQIVPATRLIREQY